MNRSMTVTATAALVGLALALPATGSAQNPDHLECYKIKDTFKYEAQVDLIPLQLAYFPEELDCKVTVKAKEFCIPVVKELLRSDAPGTLLRDGQALINDYICYKLKCEDPPDPIETITFTDQFSSRRFEKFKAKKICAPGWTGTP